MFCKVLPAVKFQVYMLMSEKWGEKNKPSEREESFTFFERASQVKTDAGFKRKNEVGSWPQALQVAFISFMPVQIQVPRLVTCAPLWSFEV